MLKYRINRHQAIKYTTFTLIFLVVLLVLSGCLGEPDAAQIKVDLIGKELTSENFLLPRGRFSAISEFQDLSIKNKQITGQILEYDVTMRLQDIETKKQYIADAIVVYKNIKGKWEIISIAPKLWKEIGEPDAAQIKADLIGKEITGAKDSFYLPRWRFAAISEFQDLSIKNKQITGQILEFDVTMRLQDIETKKEYLADAIIVYKNIKGKWEIISIAPKLWKDIK